MRRTATTATPLQPPSRYHRHHATPPPVNVGNGGLILPIMTRLYFFMLH